MVPEDSTLPPLFFLPGHSPGQEQKCLTLANRRRSGPIPDSSHANHDAGGAACQVCRHLDTRGAAGIRIEVNQYCLEIHADALVSPIAVQIWIQTRTGDRAAQQFALYCGACWAGDSTEPPPAVLDAALIFAPVGAPMSLALQVVAKGGTVVCGGIHVSDIPAFPYRLL